MKGRIVIGSDHAGFFLKESLKRFLAERGFEVEDVGAFSSDPVDYPDICESAVRKYEEGGYDFGILICGTGVGMSVAANKFRGIRAALCADPLTARLSRQHNDANFLCLGARIIGEELAKEIARVFLETPFEGGRHIPRLEKIKALEER